MDGLSMSRELVGLEKIQFLNKVLGDENIGEFGLDGDNVFE
jgi:hypothetical protein